MKAKQLIDGAAFGPAALKAIGDAFDMAWADIEHAFTTPHAKEAARLTLAQAILDNATNDSRDVHELRLHGQRELMNKYPHAMADALTKKRF